MRGSPNWKAASPLNRRKSTLEMAALKWTRQALADVQRLHQFLNDKNPDSAIRAVKAIRSGVRILQSQPRIGHPASDMAAGYREWLIPFGHSGYVVLYRIDGEEVILLALRHGREAGYKL
jgi:addiction module RelE/StbE family toxin